MNTIFLTCLISPINVLPIILFYLLQMRSKFLEGGKVLSLFYAIIKQFDVLSESHDIDVTVGYKNIFNLCLNVSIAYFKLLLD